MELLVNDQDILNAKILLVDDQLENITLLERILRRAGYKNITSTTESKHALELYNEVRPDLVILDLMMPPPDGFAVLSQISDLEGDYAPVLILSAITEPELRIRALSSGAKDFLNKPLEPTEALTRIRNMLEVRLMYKSIKMHNVSLNSLVKERTRELAESRLEIILRLGRAGEYRDNETAKHVVRISYYSEILGKAAGLSNDDNELLLNASPMHDIGKIGIPDAILLKQDRLTEEEWAIMKRHTVIGADILSGHTSPLLKMAHDIALMHHERWDGTGYPLALRGEEIPLTCRIVSICDAFDALTIERPYKKAWSVSDTIEQMRGERETHFDPYILDLFHDVLPEILAVREQHTS